MQIPYFVESLKDLNTSINTPPKSFLYETSHSHTIDGKTIDRFTKGLDKINNAHLKLGIYFLKIKTEKGLIIEKIIKQLGISLPFFSQRIQEMMNLFFEFGVVFFIVDKKSDKQLFPFVLYVRNSNLAHRLLHLNKMNS